MVEYSIFIEHLTKKFGSFTAVENLCLKIKKGTICGLIGPNGSGKTTTIQCLLGIYSFEKGGKILILDKNRTILTQNKHPHFFHLHY